MANIPVERNTTGGGVPWWTWLLGLLAVVGIGVLVFALNDDTRDVASGGADTTLVAQRNPGGVDSRPMAEPITELAMLRDTTAVSPRVGRDVNLRNVRVASAAGDSAFFIDQTAQATPGQRSVLVLRNEVDAARLKAGDTVDVMGTVARFDSTARGISQVPRADRDRLMRGGLYVRADRVVMARADSVSQR